MSTIRIREISIENIYGTKSFSLKAGALNILSGHNGSNKTSFLDGLKRVFIGGHDPAMLRRGAKVGKLILCLSDERKIVMTTTAKGTTYEFLSPDGVALPAPRTLIEDLADSLSVDPVAILSAKEKDLTAILLKVMPITFNPAEIEAALGTDELYPIPTAAVDLDTIAIMRKTLFETRTTYNRDLKAAEGSLTNLRSSLPADDDVDWAMRVEEFEGLEKEATKQRQDELDLHRGTALTAEREINTWRQNEISRIEAEYKNALKVIQENLTSKEGEVNTAWEPEIKRVTTELATAKERARTKDRAEGIRTMIRETELKREKFEEKSDLLTTALEGIDSLKQTKLEELPIQGLELREGSVYFRDIPFHRQNKATRLEVAFQIAGLYAEGQLPLMLIDEAENMVDITWDEFKAAAVESGFQIFAARAEAGPLTVEVINPDTN
jgi:hypothetical protein